MNGKDARAIATAECQPNEKRALQQRLPASMPATSQRYVVNDSLVGDRVDERFVFA
ncbi:hypothetical protein [cf. Phormidesmis sp. LEGE 11477]|uniref:hypothetical protein n=1 Tax=cf. Phormidesmis sp. LEGE 11477 TaxID=1828680 RepID=UPI00187F111F|nr:hypothetical protein [cf. Phormidesmis sp. LEGE 11477]MBE9064302.1 hypothetical protein [cf. Phormidesmis sp. LEGE 11477]